MLRFSRTRYSNEVATILAAFRRGQAAITANHGIANATHKPPPTLSTTAPVLPDQLAALSEPPLSSITTDMNAPSLSSPASSRQQAFSDAANAAEPLSISSTSMRMTEVVFPPAAAAVASAAARLSATLVDSRASATTSSPPVYIPFTSTGNRIIPSPGFDPASFGELFSQYLEQHHIPRTAPPIWVSKSRSRGLRKLAPFETATPLSVPGAAPAAVPPEQPQSRPAEHDAAIVVYVPLHHFMPEDTQLLLETHRIDELLRVVQDRRGLGSRPSLYCLSEDYKKSSVKWVMHQMYCMKIEAEPGVAVDAVKRDLIHGVSWAANAVERLTQTKCVKAPLLVIQKSLAATFDLRKGPVAEQTAKYSFHHNVRSQATLSANTSSYFHCTMFVDWDKLLIPSSLTEGDGAPEPSA